MYVILSSISSSLVFLVIRVYSNLINDSNAMKRTMIFSQLSFVAYSEGMHSDGETLSQSGA